MKISLGNSNFLEEISSLFYSCFPLFLCIGCWGRLSYLSLLFLGTLYSNGYIFPFLLCFSLLFFSQLFVRPPQTTILCFCISFSWGWSWLAAWCWSDFKEIPHIQGQRGSPSKKVGEAKSRFESNPSPTREAQRAQTKFLRTRTQRPHRDWARTVLSVSCGGVGQQWTATGQGLWVQ